MKPNRKQKQVTAADLMNKLQQDPAYVARMAAKNKEHQERFENAAKQAVPILQDLAKAGFGVQSLEELRKSGEEYKKAIPILLKWLPNIANVQVKSSIVRTLSVPWARPEAAPGLIEEFEVAPNSENSGLKWTIGNALAVVADDSVLEKIIAMAQNQTHGKAREMVVLSLANMKSNRAVAILRQLLKDTDVCGYAIIALGKRGVVSAARDIQPFLDHPTEWVREEAKKSLTIFERKGDRYEWR